MNACKPHLGKSERKLTKFHAPQVDCPTVNSNSLQDDRLILKIIDLGSAPLKLITQILFRSEAAHSNDRKI